MALKNLPTCAILRLQEKLEWTIQPINRSIAYGSFQDIKTNQFIARGKQLQE